LDSDPNSNSNSNIQTLDEALGRLNAIVAKLREEKSQLVKEKEAVVVEREDLQRQLKEALKECLRRR